jgi:hypothetical protein
MESRDHSDMLCNIVSGILIATLFSGLQYRVRRNQLHTFILPDRVEGQSSVMVKDMRP